MVRIERRKGKTYIYLGGLTIATDKINRHTYNRLRKKDMINMSDILKALRQENPEE